MSPQTQTRKIKTAPFIFGAVFLLYFFSDAVLRQFVLYRAGTQSINLNVLLDKLPSSIKDEVKQKITIAELRDKLLAASTDGEKISASIALAGAISEKDLQEKYAEIIDKYPSAPESAPAFVNYLMAPPTALKSISVSKYHEYINQLHDPERFYAWDSGFTTLKSKSVKPKELLDFLRPLLDAKPEYREYQRLYLELAELAFQEDEQTVEIKARKLEEVCGKLQFYDKVLGAAQAKKTKK
ncbi:MAG: hypothetical protein ACYC4Q_04045 [Victivallaceae bacterium]